MINYFDIGSRIECVPYGINLGCGTVRGYDQSVDMYDILLDDGREKYAHRTSLWNIKDGE